MYTLCKVRDVLCQWYVATQILLTTKTSNRNKNCQEKREGEKERANWEAKEKNDKKNLPKCGSTLYLNKVINDAYGHDDHKKHRCAVADDTDGTDDAKCTYDPRV